VSAAPPLLLAPAAAGKRMAVAAQGRVCLASCFHVLQTLGCVPWLAVNPWLERMAKNMDDMAEAAEMEVGRVYVGARTLRCTGARFGAT
jgi:hypothetical protein